MGKFQQFEYLAGRVKAGKTAGLKIFLAGLLGFCALGVVLLLMIQSARPSSKTAAVTSTSGTASMDQFSRVFEENEQRIKALQATTQSLLKQVPAAPTGVSVSSEDKKAVQQWQLREKAPTEVYVEGGSDDVLKSGISKRAGGDDIPTVASLLQLGKTEAGSATTTSVAEKMAHPERTVAQGEFIHAVLETAINSELPGMVRAEITEPVYSYRGEHVLIPEGSRLIGQYASLYQNGAASARVFVIWNRIITPLGVSLLIQSPGIDTLGRSGMGADWVDSHFFQIFGQAILLSVIGSGVSTWDVSGSDQPNSKDQLRQSIGNALRDSATQSLNNSHISPTLHIHQGDLVNVFVARDLELPG